MENEVRVAVCEGRGVVLQKSRPLLRDKMTMYIKEVLADPLVCAEHCCYSGFRRAGTTQVLYKDDSVAPNLDQFVPPSMCQECGRTRTVTQRRTTLCVLQH